MTHYLALLACVVFPLLSYGQTPSQKNIDSLHAALNIAKDDTNKVKILDHLVFAYATVDPDKGIAYGNEGLGLAKRLKWEKGTAKLLAGLGINYAAKDDHARALQYHHQALSMSNKLNDRAATAGNLANISLVHLARSEYATALDHALRALKIYEALADEHHIAIILENTGTIYFRQKNYPKTIEYYAQAATKYKKQGDKRALARNLGNMGIVHDARGDYRQALENHISALKTNEELNAKYSIEINLANIGLVYAHLKEYQHALSYQFKALSLSESLNRRTSVAINLGNIGETYFAMANDSSHSDAVQKKASLHKAIHYLTKAIEICKELKFYDPLIEFSDYLSDAYYLSGDYRLALDNYKKYTTLKDSVFSAQNQQYIANLEANRQIERKDQELRLKEKQLRITELKAAREKDEQIIYIITISLLLLVIGIGLKQIFSYRKHNRSLMLERQNQYQVIDGQIKTLKAHAKTLEDISYMQAHDVRGPVATILGLVENFNFKNYADPDNRVIIEGIGSIARKLDVAVMEVIKKEKSV